jgi:hypothetical protein
MIRIGFGMTSISVGSGTDLSFKAIMKAIRIAIGTDVMKAVEIVITVPVKARAARASGPSVKAVGNSPELKLRNRKRCNLKLR